jgi:hypothetical protein
MFTEVVTIFNSVSIDVDYLEPYVYMKYMAYLQQ